jgi:hypothetical protein
MKSNSLTSVLLGVLAISALGSMILYVMWASTIRDSRRIQLQVYSAQYNKNMANMLATDLLEYSKRNPAIDPLLVEFGFKPKPGAGPANLVKPATK